MAEKTVHTIVVELTRADTADDQARKAVQQQVFAAVDAAVQHEGLAVEATSMRIKTVAVQEDPASPAG